MLTSPLSSGTYKTVAARGDSRALYPDTYDSLLKKLRPPKNSFVIAQHNHAYELVAPRVDTFGALPEDISEPDLLLTGPSDTDCKRIKRQSVRPYNSSTSSMTPVACGFANFLMITGNASIVVHSPWMLAKSFLLARRAKIR